LGILHKIREGGMGIVYEAEDLGSVGHVALKFFPERLAHDAQSLSRFRRQAEAASSLNRSNIRSISAARPKTPGDAAILCGSR
jgi:serine/threonine protein kinase